MALANGSLEFATGSLKRKCLEVNLEIIYYYLWHSQRIEDYPWDFLLFLVTFFLISTCKFIHTYISSNV